MYYGYGLAFILGLYVTKVRRLYYIIGSNAVIVQDEEKAEKESKVNVVIILFNISSSCVIVGPDVVSCSQIHSPSLGDKVDCGIGLSYRPSIAYES